MSIDINDFENRVEEHLTSALLDHYRAILARKHGRARLASRWRAEMRARLDRDLVVTLLLPVHGPGERRRVYENCVSRAKSHDAVLRESTTRHVAEELGVPELTQSLDEADTAAFWQRVTSVADAWQGDLQTEEDGMPLSALEQSPDEIIAAVLHRFVTHETSSENRISRRVLVVDDDLEDLAPALVAANFRVVRASVSELSADELGSVLGQRVLVTRETQGHYINYAPIHEFGIIGLDALPHIDHSRDYATNATAQLLSRAFLEHKLASRLSFVLLLHPEGLHAFHNLE
jgi:hypothetical protein